ncbi:MULTISPECIES: hypothetical protein [unclassified Sphingosinithalassobacter]|uniref:hypothetical protein n=1 Tax=unclassified Sphingosinithalassobacter TaxID=2676235 RepID=UPI00165DB231|nr:hypothetical protein [Sphingosinithalassobacter sp. CS137]
MEIDLRLYGDAVVMNPVRVRLAGIERRDAKGNAVASVTLPTEQEATAALQRAARVQGADEVLRVASDYRRLALAAGPGGNSAAVEVNAWGTAVRRKG